MNRQTILILDFGSQYTQLIARRVREAGVYSEVHPSQISAEAVAAIEPAGIILSGGPETVRAGDTWRAPDYIFELGCPVLGICYGMQTMVQQLGGTVELGERAEFGYAKMRVQESVGLFAGLTDDVGDAGYIDVWMSHHDAAAKLPDGFVVIGSTPEAPMAAIADESRHFYGVQFHPEVTHTPQGQQLLSHFVHSICGCRSDWTTEHIAEELVEQCRERVGDDHVLLALSGGVDSSVTAALLHRAIGDRLHCVFVNTGLLRTYDLDDIHQVFELDMALDITIVDASRRFMRALKRVKDPEKKRRRCGHQFIKEFQRFSKSQKHIKWLAQGTIYPDVIESAKASADGSSHVIKSHHNVGGLPKKMKFLLLEPLRELFKDEVRAVGLQLGLPRQLVQRHPFPGPGLAVRILGEVKPEWVKVVQKADQIFITALRRHDLYDQISQAFAVFVPVKTVGVKGDARHEGYVIALRAVRTIDFMTATAVHLPEAVISEVARRIVNDIPEVARVVYDISDKPPGTIEWE